MTLFSLSLKKEPSKLIFVGRASLYVTTLMLKSKTYCSVSMGVGKGGRGGLDPLDFEIISQKRLFFSISRVKN